MLYTIAKNLEISNTSDGTWLHFSTNNGKKSSINLKLKLGEVEEQWAKEFYENVLKNNYYSYLDNFITGCIEDSVKNIIAETATDGDYNDFISDVKYYIHKLTSLLENEHGNVCAHVTVRD